MSAPPNETLRDLLNLLRASDDDSAREPPDRRQDVGGPYRSERETLEAQVADALARLEHEQALLNERRALISAVRRASRPEVFPRRFARTLAFGAFLGTVTSITTLFVMIAPMLGPDSRVTLRPPSEWHVPATPTPPAGPVRTRTPVVLPAPSGAVEWGGVPCGGDDGDLGTESVARTYGRGFTPITATVWDVDRTALREALIGASSSLRLIRNDDLGIRLYGVRRASSAGQLGLHNGDELIAIDGVLVRDLMEEARTPAMARRLAHEVTRNSRVEVSLVRHGVPMTFTYLLR